MSRPTSKSSGHEDQVRKRAHAMWEKEGRPHGKEQEHWEKALQELGTEKEPARTPDKKNKKQSAGAGSSRQKHKR